jgi:penicillin-binding protein 1C
MSDPMAAESFLMSGKGPPRRRPFRRAALRAAALALALGVMSAGWWIVSLPPMPRTDEIEYSTLVLGRDGALLRPYATAQGRWRLPANVGDVDPRYLAMLLAYEDRRFRSHPGVDPLALGRAAYQWARHGRIVSGGSTLTMQVARLLEPRGERSMAVKLRQTLRALQLEWRLSKDEILALYLSLAPYGGNLEGVRAASLAYFGKEPRRLTLAESALLVALPQSPELRRPDRSAAAARAARDRVLDRIAAAGLVPADEIAQAKQEPVPDGRKPMPMLAPHAADQAVAAAPGRRIHRLTIDAGLQKRLQELARERARSLGPDISVAIVVIENSSGAVLARVGSADYLDERRAGHVDMTQALRSPGSALKPFIYGLAFEDGLAHPETLIEDRPARYGNYAPENFDLSFQGTVSVRRALQMSLNVPAVALLDRVGAARMSARLLQAGAPLVLPKHEAPGLAMALGGVGVRLTDLTGLYSGFPRLGTTLPITERADGTSLRAPMRLLEPAAAWYVANILLGTPPPENAAGGRIAYKTGTSYGYRDAWAIGFDGGRTIGVWVGRPDGAPVLGLTGRSAAAPILFDAFARTAERPQMIAHAPAGVLLASNARLPPPLRHFRAAGVAAEPERTLRIMYPPNGAQIEFAATDGKPDPVVLKVTGGVEPLILLVNGVPVATETSRRPLLFTPDGPGFVRVTVMDASGAAESILLRIQ